MFDKPFNDVLGTPAKVAVLRVLASVTSPLTGRAIEVLADIAHAACLRALQELSTAKVVIFKQYGREKLYELNQENKIFRDALKQLFGSEDVRKLKFLQRLRNWIKHKKLPVVQASIFGSVARQEDRLGSDLDLLFIVNTLPEKARLLEAWVEIEPEISIQYSVTVSPYILTHRDLLARHKAGDPVIRSAVQEGYSLTEQTLKDLIYEKIQR